MSPDPRSKRGRKSKVRVSASAVKALTRASSDDPHKIVYFVRDVSDDPNRSMPARDFLLKKCPTSVADTLRAVLIAVAKAPPKRFAGGGMWEVMHGSMKGWYEVRVDGPGRTHYRLFCLLDYDAPKESEPLLVVVTGMKKAFLTKFSESDYAKVRALGTEYMAHRSE